ncbi:hypothetical protein [Chryseobacterium sp.]|uniref:hypothetical protein n=1 Tax=Chryseobacterium sp. TaxID=1871047 RepID=UPI0025C0C74C|nr:hypothetical protein [Chryseobacterium sp.]
MTKNYEYLIGKSKNEVLKELGDEFNFFPDEIWTYRLKTRWWKKDRTLFLFFQRNTVNKIEIK